MITVVNKVSGIRRGANINCLMALRLSGLQAHCRPDKAFMPPSGKVQLHL
ncbi:hypothetical protein HMPREF0208_00878 [Citrobacter koseri]|nr:hypothetical protein HMPREF3207_01117 [Citrobacter koseri]KXB46203.1 hypothetical protein HMPREF0208_00878 [Citrobacter koseri]